MENHKASHFTLVVISLLLPATTLLTGCGFADRTISSLTGARSKKEKAELASLSEQDVVPDDERNAEPALFDQEQPPAPIVDIASTSDGSGHVRLASHTADTADTAAVQAALPELRLPGKVEHIDTGAFAQQVLESDVPVLVDFYADWCGPCRTLAPTLDRIARETPNAKVVKVNIDDSPRIAKKYDVSSIPTVIVFKNGAAVARHTGLADESALLDMLAQ